MSPSLAQECRMALCDGVLVPPMQLKFMIEQRFFITSMPSSRMADYYLGYFDGCVFLDFNNYDNHRICLKRISFDGYGCCELSNKATALNVGDSQTFKDIVQNNLVDQHALLTIVKKAISLNKNDIWIDALEEYYLV